MLPANLELTPPHGEPMPSPRTLGALKEEYLHAADLRADPADVADFRKDLGRVLTLRQTGSPNYTTVRVERCLHRGYFAWGRQDGDEVVFEVYSPHSSVKQTFPPKELKTTMARFVVRLNEDGYAFPPKAMTYHNPL